MKRILNLLALGIFLLGLQTQAQAQILLSYWNFNNDNPVYSSGSGQLGSLNTTAAAYGEQYSSLVLSSNTSGTVFSSSAVKLDLSQLSAGVSAPIINGVVSGVGRQTTGTSNNGFGTYVDSGVNKASGDTSTANGSLILMNAAGGENGHYITLTLDSLGYNSLSLTYATRLTGGDPGTESWSYSLDGTNFTSLGSVSPTPGSFVLETLNLSSLSSSALNNQGTFYLRVSPNVALGGSISFDNVQITGIAAVPEPSTYALMGLGMLILVLTVRRKRA